MFSRQSRYYRLPSLVSQDSRGINRESKALRVGGEVNGKFIHHLESDDRLDKLAYKFYRNSKQWWRICDANPEFQSPLKLLGQHPDKMALLEIEWMGYLPPWQSLLKSVQRQVGTSDAWLGGRQLSEPQRIVNLATLVATIAPAFELDLEQAVLSQVIPPALVTELQANSIDPSSNLRVSKLADSQWLIDDNDEQEIHQINLNTGPPAALAIFETSLVFQWSLQVEFNSLRYQIEDLVRIIEAQGFVVTEHSFIGRVGKPVLVPPKFSG